MGGFSVSRNCHLYPAVSVLNRSPVKKNLLPKQKYTISIEVLDLSEGARNIVRWIVQ